MILDYPKASSKIKAIVPELPSIQRTILAKNISDLFTYGKCHLDPVPIVRFLKISGTIDETQQETLLELIDKATKN